MIKQYPTLYSRDSSQNVRVWFMEQDGAKYRATSGIQHGQHVVSEWTTALVKNEGKANETSPEEQAAAEIAAKYKKQIAQNGYFEKVADIDQTTFFAPMLAHKWDDYKEDIDWTNGIYVSPKLDGLRCLMTKDGAFSRNGKPFTSFPHIYSKLKPLFDKNPTLVFDGEIYSHKFKKDFNKIISLAKKTKPTQEDFEESERYLEYWIFDLPSHKTGYHGRYQQMRKLIFDNYHNDKHIILCKHEVVKSEDELKAKFSHYISEGFEGLMANTYEGEYLQKRSRNILKYKEFCDCEAEIVDIIEGQGNRSGMFGYAKLRLKNGVEFDANARGNQEFYRELLKDRQKLKGEMVTVRYQNLTPDKKPRFPVIIAVRNYE